MRALSMGVVAALVLTCLPAGPASAAPAPTAATVAAGVAASSGSSRADVDGDHRGVTLAADGGPTSRRPANVAWPRGDIRYFETIPAKWQWGLERAIEQWNTSGAKVRFVKVATKAKAQVTIGYGETYGADGYGGWTARGRKIFKGFVHVNESYKKVDEKDDEQRVWMARLIAHELGHVLSYDHTSGQCTLMAPIFYFGTCGPLSVGRPGYYQCRFIDTALLKAHIKKYGGTAKRPAKDCLTYPLPAQLKGVSFTGGADEVGTGGSPVRISWTKISGARPLEKVRITRWPATGSCASEPDNVFQVFQPVSTTTWVDPEPGEGTACYRVQAANHSGIGPAGTSRLMRRFAPTPAAPVLGAPAWGTVRQQWYVTWDAPASMSLRVQRGPAGSCPATFDDGAADYLYEEGANRYYVDAYAVSECFSFFAVDGLGKSSAPTQLEVTVPPPPGPPTVGTPVYDPDQLAWVVAASVPSDVDVSFNVLAGTCPAAVAADTSFDDSYRLDPEADDYLVYQPYPWEPGQFCLQAAVVDYLGDTERHGAVTMVQATAPAP